MSADWGIGQLTHSLLRIENLYVELEWVNAAIESLFGRQKQLPKTEDVL